MIFFVLFFGNFHAFDSNAAERDFPSSVNTRDQVQLMTIFSSKKSKILTKTFGKKFGLGVEKQF